MTRSRALGGLSVRPSLTPTDVQRVAASPDGGGLWLPCAEGCCLRCRGGASGAELAAALRRLLRGALALAGVREVDGAVAVVGADGRLVTVTASRNRVAHRTSAAPVGRGHAPVRPGGPEPEGGGRVVSLLAWR